MGGGGEVEEFVKMRTSFQDFFYSDVAIYIFAILYLSSMLYVYF